MNGREKRRNWVEKTIREAVDPERFETIASGSQTPDEVIFPGRIDATTGYWMRSHISKPPRWLIHLKVTQDDNVQVVVPEHDVQRRLGQGNTTGGKLPKACLIFLVVPMARNEEGTYARVDDWEWILYFILNRPTPRITSSTGFTAPKLAQQVLAAQGQKMTFVHAGLVELLPPDHSVRLPGLATRLEYGEVSRQLLELLKNDRAPEADTL